MFLFAKNEEGFVVATFPYSVVSILVPPCVYFAQSFLNIFLEIFCFYVYVCFELDVPVSQSPKVGLFIGRLEYSIYIELYHLIFDDKYYL